MLSEKPIAKDVEAATELLAWYEGLGAARPIWGIGENFRFWESIEYAQGKLAEMGGEVVTFGFEMFKFVNADDKYFNTACKLPSLLLWSLLPDTPFPACWIRVGC